MTNDTLAGDTAQCISRDNTFRFEDIKARFYEHFLAMARNAGEIDWAKPSLFPLVKNYRSHQGILSLAADIVDMLCKGERTRSPIDGKCIDNIKNRLSWSDRCAPSRNWQRSGEDANHVS